MTQLSQYPPDQVLLLFVERLPTTVREIVLARCCLAFGRLHLTQKQDLLATFRSVLKAPEGELRAYVYAQMAAVIELALYRERVHGWLAHRLEESERFSHFDLESPLAQKHWAAAREEFRGLRESVLNAEGFHEAFARPAYGLDAAEQRRSH